MITQLNSDGTVTVKLDQEEVSQCIGETPFETVCEDFVSAVNNVTQD